MSPARLPQKATPVSLKATAGLRLLPGDKADKILLAVEEKLKGTPFRLAEGAVAIMDGAGRMPRLAHPLTGVGNAWPDRVGQEGAFVSHEMPLALAQRPARCARRQEGGPALVSTVGVGTCGRRRST